MNNINLKIEELKKEELIEALEVLNEAAKSYKKILPHEAYKEPYMSLKEFSSEAERINFLTAKIDREIVGIMGYEYKGDVALVRHGYVKPSYQRMGIGSTLFKIIEEKIKSEGKVKKMIVGMYRKAYWAVSFWSKHGFMLIDNSDEVLKRYYNILEVQIRNSIAMYKEI
jgi:GNAT superfamily N-acetyltransferase